MNLLYTVIACSVAALICAVGSHELQGASPAGARIFLLIAGGFLGYAIRVAVEWEQR